MFKVGEQRTSVSDSIVYKHTIENRLNN